MIPILIVPIFARIRWIFTWKRLDETPVFVIKISLHWLCDSPMTFFLVRIASCCFRTRFSIDLMRTCSFYTARWVFQHSPAWQLYYLFRWNFSQFVLVVMFFDLLGSVVLHTNYFPLLGFVTKLWILVICVKSIQFWKQIKT